MGRYLLLDLINRGGMADIYLAKSFGFEGIDQIFALKRIRPDVCEDPDFVTMFVDEAKLSVLLNHANIAQIFEFGRTDSNYYIAMEYVPGRDVRALLDRANGRGLHLPEHLALHIVAKVLEGLDYAHRKTDLTGVPLHIVHRDVSPHNVLLSYQGDVKLIDFGIAKAASHASRSQAGVLKGKYGYMSPEQVVGLPVDARSDVFAAGVLLYEMLTHQRLFDGASDFSILEKVRYAEIYPPSLIMPQVGSEVEAVVLKALAADPADRYASASDMGDAVVEAMLQRYGPPTSRELANLMQDLFEDEIRGDMRLLETARGFTQIPEGLENVGTPEPRSVNDLAPKARAPMASEPPRSSPAREAPTRVDIAPPSPGAERTRVDPIPPPDETTEPDIAVPPVDDTDPSAQVDVASTRIEGERTAKVIMPPDPGVFAGGLETTKNHLAYHLPRLRLSRDAVIVIGAAVVAVCLVLGSWLLSDHGGPAGLTIISKPSAAQVQLDGRVVGQTPLSSTGLQPGVHHITLTLPGYAPVHRTVEVASDRVLDVQITLSRN